LQNYTYELPDAQFKSMIIPDYTGRIQKPDPETNSPNGRI